MSTDHPGAEVEQRRLGAEVERRADPGGGLAGARGGDGVVAVVRLDRDLLSGEVVDELTDDDFRVPTTIAEHGNRLYAPNARFGTTPTPTTDYDVVQLRKN